MLRERKTTLRKWTPLAKYIWLLLQMLFFFHPMQRFHWKMHRSDQQSSLCAWTCFLFFFAGFHSFLFASFALAFLSSCERRAVFESGKKTFTPFVSKALFLFNYKHKCCKFEEFLFHIMFCLTNRQRVDCIVFTQVWRIQHFTHSHQNAFPFNGVSPPVHTSDLPKRIQCDFQRNIAFLFTFLSEFAHASEFTWTMRCSVNRSQDAVVFCDVTSHDDVDMTSHLVSPAELKRTSTAVSQQFEKDIFTPHSPPSFTRIYNFYKEINPMLHVFMSTDAKTHYIFPTVNTVASVW